MSNIPRSGHATRVRSLLRQFPVVAIVGARQVGKTTLARQVAATWKGPVTTFDLESPDVVARFDDPMLAFGRARGLVVIDEVQRRPELFPALRVLADEPGVARRFLVLGSAAPALLRQASESLAGRIAYHELTGLDLGEVGAARFERLWLRGGYPRSFLAQREAASMEWRQAFIDTFLQRDIPALGIRIAPAALRRFWMMIAHYHAQTWKGSELGRAFALSHTTVRSYLDLLTGTFMLRQLPPWHENISKRQVRAPKVYVRDSGLLHALLRVNGMADLESHPKVGASWEGFAVQTVLDRLDVRDGEAYFWGTHGGAELDLLVVRGKTRLGFEVKRTTAPRVTPSMRAALADLHLDRIDVVHGGDQTYPLADRVRAVAATRLLEDL